MIESLGHYKVLEHIGAGRMGDVYRARDTRHGRTVAIRVVPDAIARNPERRARLLDDARAAASLSHPNLVTLYEVGEDGERLFLVFDFVPGETLAAAMGGRPLHPRRAIDLAIQISDGLADAHAAGIVHRDIRPDTVIVTPKGAAKILDVGLASWTTGGTSTGAGPYVSPEQIRGERVDEGADIFSVGAVLFEMLTGRPPVGAAIRAGAAARIAPVPSSITKSLAPEIDAVVAKALAGSGDGRYQSAATLAADLRSLAAMLDARSEAADRAPVPVRVRAPRRSRAGWILAVVIAALAAAAWVFYGR